MKHRRSLNRMRHEMARAMEAAFTPERMQAVWNDIVAAQQRLIARRDPNAFDLLAVAREHLGGAP